VLIKLFGDSFKFLDKNIINKNFSEEQKFAWFMDQYKNPKESSHTYNEVLNWFKNSNIEFISSIPFSFSSNSLINSKLFSKKESASGLNMFLSEFSQSFSIQQIREGGFFIMIGKKI